MNLLKKINDEHWLEYAYSKFSDDIDYSDVSNWIDFDDEVESFVLDNFNRIVIKSNIIDKVLDFFSMSTLTDIMSTPSLSQIVSRYRIASSQCIFNFIRVKNYKVNMSRHVINNITYYILKPNNTNNVNISNRTIMFAHGGGLVIGNTYLYLNNLEYMCEKLNCMIVSVDYTLDGDVDQQGRECVEVLSHLELLVDPNLILMGDSAGATIINRTLYMLNRNFDISNYDNFIRRNVIYLYPCLTEVYKLSPGRFASIVSKTLINLRFMNQYKSITNMHITEFYHIDRLKMNNIITIAVNNDFLIEDSRVIEKSLNSKMLYVDSVHGFLINPIKTTFMQNVTEFINNNIYNT